MLFGPCFETFAFFTNGENKRRGFEANGSALFLFLYVCKSNTIKIQLLKSPSLYSSGLSSLLLLSTGFPSFELLCVCICYVFRLVLVFIFRKPYCDPINDIPCGIYWNALTSCKCGCIILGLFEVFWILFNQNEIYNNV